MIVFKKNYHNTLRFRVLNVVFPPLIYVYKMGTSVARLRADDGITVPSDIQFLYPSTIQLNKVDLNLQNRKASTQTSVIHVDSFFL